MGWELTTMLSRYEQGARLAGIIYMHRISDTRLGGTSSRNFRIFRELCGESTLRNVLIVTNMWSEVDPQLGEEREQELATNPKFFKPVVDRGARMLRNLNTPESAHAILRHLINAQAHTLQIQHELVNERKDLAQTSAGTELTRVLKEQSDRHEEQLREVRRELEEAMRAKDEEARKELEQEIGKKQDEIDQIRLETERMAAEFAKERARLEARIAEMERAHAEQLRNLEEQAQREKELITARDEAEKRASDLTKKLETATNLEEQAQREKELITARDEAEKRASNLAKKLETVTTQQSRKVCPAPLFPQVCRQAYVGADWVSGTKQEGRRTRRLDVYDLNMWSETHISRGPEGLLVEASRKVTRTGCRHLYRFHLFKYLQHYEVHIWSMSWTRDLQR